MVNHEGRVMMIHGHRMEMIMIGSSCIHGGENGIIDHGKMRR